MALLDWPSESRSVHLNISILGIHSAGGCGGGGGLCSLAPLVKDHRRNSCLVPFRFFLQGFS